MDAFVISLLFPVCTACLGWFVHHWFAEVNENIKELTEAVRKRVHVGDFKESLNRVHMRVDEVETIQRELNIRLVDMDRRMDGMGKRG